MSLWFVRISNVLAVTTFLAMNAFQSANAAPQDYRFEAVQSDVKSGPAVIIGARLIDVRTGKAVPGATIQDVRFDMSPTGMASMTSKVTAVEAQDPGVYMYRAPITMDGEWALHLSAKVPGEADVVRGSVKIRARK